MKKVSFQRLMSLVTALLLFLSIVQPMNVLAKTKTVKKLKYDSVDYVSGGKKKLEKKSFKIKKGKNYSLKVSEGFLRFKAPKKGVYKFTFSGLKSTRRKTVNQIEWRSDEYCTVWPLQMSKKGSFIEPSSKIKTQGWKDKLWDNRGFSYLASKAYIKHYGPFGYDKLFNRPLASRYFSTSLKKGEILYLHVKCEGPCTVKLKVK